MAGAFVMGGKEVKILDKTLEEKYEELEKRMTALEEKVQIQPQSIIKQQRLLLDVQKQKLKL